MNRLLTGSLLLLCFAGTWAAGCSSNKTAATNTGGAASIPSAVGGISANLGGGSNTGGGNNTGGAEAGDTTPKTITPDDTAHLFYSGRIDFTDPTKPTFAAPGALVAARFTGVSVKVMFQDHPTGNNFYEIVVDHDPTMTYIITPQSTTTSYDVVSNLPYGDHLVEFAKRTETSQGSVTFLGFELGGTLLAAPTKPTRRIEIIGDSISAGSGIEPGVDQVNCNTASGNLAQNAYLSYGAVLARNLNAEYHITAAGGRGAWRNYECGSLDTLPAGYDHMNQRDLNSPLWDHTKYVPDAIIVALGTNDFSPDSCNEPPLSAECDPVGYQDYISAMETFITRLRGYFPDAQIIMISSPMLADGWPSPVSIDGGAPCPYTSRTSNNAAMETVRDYFNNDAGDSKVHLVESVPKGAGLGCGTHPNVTEAAEIGGTSDTHNPQAADILLNPVKQIMGW